MNTNINDINRDLLRYLFITFTNIISNSMFSINKTSQKKFWSFDQKKAVEKMLHAYALKKMKKSSKKCQKGCTFFCVFLTFLRFSGAR